MIRDLTPSRPPRARRPHLTAPALGAVLALGLAGALAGCSGSSGGGATASPGSSVGATTRPTATSTAAVKPPPVATDKPSVAISSAPPVKVGSPSSLKQGVDVLVSRVRTVKVKANGPGEIAGAGVAVSLSVKNTSSAAFSLSGLVVNVTYGKNRPASPGGTENGKPLTGTLKPGASAQGSYVFSVPKGQSGSVKVSVTSDESPLILQFDN